MPQPANLSKAQLIEIWWNKQHKVSKTGKKITVQFNPQTLRVNFVNQVTSGSQKAGAGKQYVGKGTTKLSLDLWFDVTAPMDAERGIIQEKEDVRRLTKEVVYFITPKKKRIKIKAKKGKDGKKSKTKYKTKYKPPGLRFVWGTFLFDGIVESMNEELEFFSEDGKPLRAKLSISIAKQEIQFQFNKSAAANGANGAGTTPLQKTRLGDTVQGVAGRNGQLNNWKELAIKNNIENPRRMKAGTPLDIDVI